MDWFRMYDEIIDDPKTLCLKPEVRWFYVGILCVSNRQSVRGSLPKLSHLAEHLRISERRTLLILNQLVEAELIDKSNDGKWFKVHGWEKRQRKSDDVRNRVAEWRRNNPVTLQKRDSNDTRVRVTEAETETEAEADTEASGVPVEHRTDTRLACKVRSDAVARWGEIDLDSEMQSNELIRAWGDELAGAALDKAFRTLGPRNKPWHYAASVCRNGLTESNGDHGRPKSREDMLPDLPLDPNSPYKDIKRGY